jgi:acyl-CoA synthetase (AMP-forming)/AMP-acid ligase II
MLLDDDNAGGHVGCGRAFGDTKIAIVDPQTAHPVDPGAIGEIWVGGDSIASGYWNNPDATNATFNATLATDQNSKWLRTGDLGFIGDGELFITGRLRELIIIAGRNHFPVDLERTTETADAAIATGGAAAFSVDINGVERLIILAEVRREFVRSARGDGPPKFDAETACRNIRSAVAAEHEVAVHDVVLVRWGALPRTTSGKLSRSSARDAYLNNTLERFADLSYVHAGN